MTTVEIYRDATKAKRYGCGEWRWRAKRKGRIVADCGEGYTRRSGCLKAVHALLYDGNIKVTEGGRDVTLQFENAV